VTGAVSSGPDAASPGTSAQSVQDAPRGAPPLTADLYRLLLENMSEGVSLSDESGVIVYTNPAEDLMFGYEPGELVGQHISVQSAYPPEENARIVSEVIAELKRSGAWRGEWLNCRKDGSRFVTTSRISAVELDGRSYWLCIQEDVTNEKAVIAALEESRTRLQLATEAAAIGVWDWDIVNGSMRCSAQAKAICGFDLDQELTYEDARRITHPADHTRIAEETRLALDPAAQERKPYEYRVVRPDGEVRWLLASGNAIFEEVGGEVRATRYVGTLQDITDRRRLEEERIASEARLRLAIEAGGMAVVEADFVADTIIGSPELNRLLGFPEDASPTPHEIRARYFPGERERIYAIAKAALARGERTVEAEYRYVWPDRTIRWLMLRAEILTDASQRPSKAIGVILDITKRKEAEDALRASNDRFRCAVEAIEGVLWTNDPDGRMVGDQPGWAALTGQTYEEYQGFGWSEVVHPDDAQATVVAWQQAVAECKMFVHEHRVCRHDGVWRLFSIRAIPVMLSNGVISEWVGVHTDITEQRAAEEALKRLVSDAVAERDVFADIVEGATATTVALDLDYNILAINRSALNAFQRIYGKTAQVGANLLELLAEMPEHQEQIRQIWTRAFVGEDVVVTDTFGDEAHDQIAYEARFSSLRDREGRVIGAWHTAYDVTDRLRAEADLLATQEALRQSQKMEAMGQLTGGVAHDFNNLLTPIVGSLDMLQRKGIGGEREQRLIAGAIQSADRAKILVQRLLAFARRQPLQPSVVDIANLVTGMAELVASTTGPQIKVSVDAPSDLPAAKADPNQLEMAILNLAVNARDAMPDGGTLRISTTTEDVEREHGGNLKPGAYVHLSVADTGVGMDEATLARAIEPFFSTKGIGRGTGLGLSMVHGLASQLGGALTITSRSGLGTNVELWLPVADTPAQGTTPGIEETPEMIRAGKALLVDDEDLVRSSTADMLTDLGYDVTEATSAEEALQLLDGGLSPDVVITDHLMPGMNGTELARIVQAQRPGTRVLIISGYAESEGIAPDLPRLTKPFRMSDLAAVLRH
jgi:PAS domain S-box-containing protein